MRIDGPVAHMAGGPRWDLRATLIYRDADAAVGASYYPAAEAVMKRLYPDAAKHIREEAERMGLFEEDVVVEPVE